MATNAMKEDANVDATDELTREPLYQQLNQRLRALAQSTEFPVGGQFLTERQVSERFQVSRATANKALSNLVAEGLLTFRKGVGTFVSARSMDYNLRALVSFTEEAIAAGKKPKTELLAFQELIAREAKEAAQRLEVTQDTALQYLERLRLADGLPVIFERRYIVAEFCKSLTAKDARGSLYSLWKDRFQLDIEGAEVSIRAVNLSREEANILRTRQNAAGLLITSTGYLKGHRPLWFERTLYRGDAYEFHNRLTGVQGTREPIGKFLPRPGKGHERRNGERRLTSPRAR